MGKLNLRVLLIKKVTQIFHCKFKSNVTLVTWKKSYDYVTPVTWNALPPTLSATLWTQQNILMGFQSSTFRFRHTMEMWISHNKSLSGICLLPSFTHFFPLLSSPSSSQAFFLFLLHCSRLCVEENQSQKLHGNRSKRIIPSCSSPLYLLQRLNPWAPHTWCVSILPCAFTIQNRW